MQTKLWKLSLIGLLILAVLGLSVYGGIKYYLKYERAVKELNKAEVNLRIYDAVVGEQREKIYESRLVIAEVERKLEISEDQKERLKQMNIRNVKVIGQLELQISSYRDSLTIYNPREYDIEVEGGEYEMIEVEQTADGAMLPLPASFGYQDEWVKQWAKIDTSGLGSIGFELEPFMIDLTLGSRGLWNKSYVSAASTDSPHVVISKNSFQMVDSRKKVWPYVAVGGLGVILGVVLGGL
jgi:hypothetical protein